MIYFFAFLLSFSPPAFSQKGKGGKEIVASCQGKKNLRTWDLQSVGLEGDKGLYPENLAKESTNVVAQHTDTVGEKGQAKYVQESSLFSLLLLLQYWNVEGEKIAGDKDTAKDFGDTVSAVARVVRAKFKKPKDNNPGAKAKKVECDPDNPKSAGSISGKSDPKELINCLSKLAKQSNKNAQGKFDQKKFEKAKNLAKKVLDTLTEPSYCESNLNQMKDVKRDNGTETAVNTICNSQHGPLLEPAKIKCSTLILPKRESDSIIKGLQKTAYSKKGGKKEKGAETQQTSVRPPPKAKYGQPGGR